MRNGFLFIFFVFLSLPAFTQSYNLGLSVKIDGNTPALSGMIDSGDQFGQGVSAIQDLDGDGIQEMVAGASFDDDAGVDRGAVYVLFMNADHTVKKYNKIIPGQGALAGMSSFSGLFGGFVTRLGDINGDGIDDIAVGEPRNGSRGYRVGKIWIIFLTSEGKAAGYSSITYGDPNFAPTPPATDIRFGTQITDIGDLNGDKIPDIAVGEGFSTPSESGAVYIIFLTRTGGVKGYTRIANNQGGLPNVLDAGDNFGISVAGIGDLNKDGIEDLAVGARFDDDGVTNGGAVYILFLNNNGTVKFYNKISTLSLSSKYPLDIDDRFGVSVSTIPDVNQDQVDDLLVGAYRDDDGGAEKGAVYLILLNGAGGVKDIFKYSSTEGGFDKPLQSSGGFGWTVSYFTDNDLNGSPEIIVSAYSEDVNFVNDGAFYILSVAGCEDREYSAGADQTICPGQAAGTNAEFRSGYTGRWEVLSGTGTFADANNPRTTVSNLSAGENIYEWIISSPVGCEYRDQVTFTKEDQEVNAGTPKTACPGSSLYMDAVLPAGYSGIWSVVAGQGDFQNALDPTTLVTNPGSGKNVYRWLVTSPAGCVYDTQVSIVYQNMISPVAVPLNCSLDAYEVTAPQLVEGISGRWSAEDNSQVTFDNSEASVTLARGLTRGSNMLYYEISGINCNLKIPLEIVVEDIELPNVITPNGDTYNEFFVIPQVLVQFEGELKIFSRWGKEVYTQSNYQNNFNGDGLKGGVYYYELTTSLCEEPYTGWLHILK